MPQYSHARELTVPHTLTARAVLFDMDGTLVESTDAVTRVWARFAAQSGVSLDYILATSQGVRMVETVRQHAPEGADVDAIVADLAAWELHDHDGVEALPGAADLLRALPKTALVTSAPRSLALVRMKAAGLPIPEVVVTADDVEFGKPRPDCYLLAAELLGVSASDAIVFEDAEAGVLAGLAAGATVVVVGALDVAATHGLLRVPDYSGVTVEVVGDEFTLSIDTAAARR